MPEKIALKIAGMSCEHCVMRVKKAAESIEGGTNVEVDLASGSMKAEVESPEKTESIKEAINEAGYQVS